MYGSDSNVTNYLIPVDDLLGFGLGEAPVVVRTGLVGVLVAHRVRLRPGHHARHAQTGHHAHLQPEAAQLGLARGGRAVADLALPVRAFRLADADQLLEHVHRGGGACGDLSVYWEK